MGFGSISLKTEKQYPDLLYTKIIQVRMHGITLLLRIHLSEWRLCASFGLVTNSKVQWTKELPQKYSVQRNYLKSRVCKATTSKVQCTQRNYLKSTVYKGTTSKVQCAQELPQKYSVQRNYLKSTVYIITTLKGWCKNAKNLS